MGVLYSENVRQTNTSTSSLSPPTTVQYMTYATVRTWKYGGLLTYDTIGSTVVKNISLGTGIQ